MKFENSKTKENLLKALQGESIAANKYQYFAKKARKDGFEQIAKIFEETSNNEKEHAKIWFKLLYGEIKNTKENLKNAVENERYEWTSMYKEFSEVAKEEGFDHISRLFSLVQSIEKTHDERYSKLLDNILNNEVFQKNEKSLWECSKCGFQTLAKEAPEKCPVCEHSQNYFFLNCKNY